MYIKRRPAIYAITALGVTVAAVAFQHNQRDTPASAEYATELVTKARDTNKTNAPALANAPTREHRHASPAVEDKNQSAKVETSNRQDGRVDQLAREVDHLESQLLRLETQQAMLDDDAMHDHDHDHEQGHSPDESRFVRDQEQEQAKAGIEDAFAVLDETGAQEGQDPAWSPDAEAELDESFAALSEHGIRLDDVTCHSSFCKAEFSITVEDDANEGDNAMRELQALAPWNAETAVWIDDLDNGAGVIYVAREGEKLALPEPEL